MLENYVLQRLKMVHGKHRIRRICRKAEGYGSKKYCKDRPDARFLFTSGYNEDIIHKKGILEKGLDFISKPFVPTEFLRKVRAVLDR